MFHRSLRFPALTGLVVFLLDLSVLKSHHYNASRRIHCWLVHDVKEGRRAGLKLQKVWKAENCTRPRKQTCDCQVRWYLSVFCASQFWRLLRKRNFENALINNSIIWLKNCSQDQRLFGLYILMCLFKRFIILWSQLMQSLKQCSVKMKLFWLRWKDTSYKCECWIQDPTLC